MPKRVSPDEVDLAISEDRRKSPGLILDIPYQKIIAGVVAGILLIMSATGTFAKDWLTRMTSAVERVPVIELRLERVEQDIKDIKSMQGDIRYIREHIEKQGK